MTVLWTLLPHTATIVTTNTIIATIPTCVSPTTSTVYGSISLCGAPAATYPSPTTGQITCTQPADAPSESVNAFHHIEADDTQGTAFEGCIFAGPSDSTTLSRGTHQCGTSTGVSLSSRKDAAARLIGFTYAGTYSPLFQDYFITRIASTAQTDIQSWGVLNNSVFTTLGGCGAQAITPAYAVTETGSSFQIAVTSRSPDGGSSLPYTGAMLSGSGAQSDANGMIEFSAPHYPGCDQYKATASGQGWSNAFYLNVVDSSPAMIG